MRWKLLALAGVSAGTIFFAATLHVPVLELGVARAADCPPEQAETRAVEARRKADALYAQAEHDDAAFAFASAVAAYDAARKLAPSAPWAPRAWSRAELLRAHDEGGFAPLAKLERVRRDPALANDPRAIDELVRAANDFPPGLVRVESWTLASEAYAHRLGRPSDAETLWERIVSDPKAQGITARKAARDLADARIARGDYAGAKKVLALTGATNDLQLTNDVKRHVRRRRIHIVSIAALALLLLLVSRALVGAVGRGDGARVRDALRRIAPLALAYALYVGVAGAALASGYESGSALPFLVFGAGLVPVLFLARAWSAAGTSTPKGRAARAGLAAVAALAVAFLVLERVDATYLDGMGL